MPGVKKGVFGELQVGLVGALYISGEDTCTWGLLRPGGGLPQKELCQKGL